MYDVDHINAIHKEHSMPRNLFLASLLFLWLNVSLAAETRSQALSLPSHGVLNLVVPATWISKIEHPTEGFSPTITFSEAHGPTFSVLVTPFWQASSDEPLPEGEILRKTVQQTANHFQQSAANNIVLHDLAGPGNAGFYFLAVDPAPKPDEWKNMMQGLFRAGDLMLAVTVLINDGQEEITQQALLMVQNAVHSTALTHHDSSLGVATIEDMKVTTSALDGDCKLLDGEYYVSVQAGTLYDMISSPEMSGLMTAPAKKLYQSIQCKDSKGTIYYYEFSNKKDLQVARGFIEGFIWGEGGRTRMHPEIIIVEQNMLIVVSSRDPEELKKHINVLK